MRILGLEAADIEGFGWHSSQISGEHRYGTYSVTDILPYTSVPLEG